MSHISNLQRIQCFKEWLEDFKKRSIKSKVQATDLSLLKVKQEYVSRNA